MQNYNPKHKVKVEDENESLKRQIHNQALKIKRLEDALREEERQKDIDNYQHDTKITFLQSQLEQFSYIVSHDLQEPVRMIKGFGDILLKNYVNKLDKDTADYLNYMVEGADKLSILINELLNYSRIGQNSTLSRINCNNSLINAQNSLNILNDRPDIHITKQELPIIYGYRKEFKLLLFNLLNNAIKFRKADEPLNININVTQKANYWEFSISDNGIGIAEDRLEEVFIVFRQLHNRNKYTGTGMGLAHCKKITDLHSGKIWATSKLGVGSTFYFTIPIVVPN